MKAYINISILSILLLSLLILVFVLLFQFKISSNFLPSFVKEEHKQEIVKQNIENSYRESIAKLEHKNFLPAVELFRLHFDIDTSSLKEKSRYYQLIIGQYDVYSMFCLRQILNAFNVKYFLLKASDSPEIFLDTDNQKLIEAIIQELKKYKIHTQVEEIWL